MEITSIIEQEDWDKLEGSNFVETHYHMIDGRIKCLRINNLHIRFKLRPEIKQPKIVREEEISLIGYTTKEGLGKKDLKVGMLLCTRNYRGELRVRKVTAVGDNMFLYRRRSGQETVGYLRYLKDFEVYKKDSDV